jgi:integrase
MPRRSLPARLWLRELKGGALWVIIDQGRQIATGCAHEDRTGAEAALAAYLANRAKPSRDSGRDPDRIPLAEILNIYLEDKAKTVARPHELARRVGNLGAFFGEKPVAALNRRLCRDYAASRGEHEQAARRELEDLAAALGHARAEEIITIHPVIELPNKAEARERWLTRAEAARLIKAAWRFKQRERDGVRSRHTRRHVARFILVGLYTGTRSAAICGAALNPAIGRGHIDLDQGVFYRRAIGRAETNKKQPPVRLPGRLLAHVRRWKRRGIALSSVVEYENMPVVSVKKAFKQCVLDAGLETEGLLRVTPHTLRHTAITWALQAGAEKWDVADFFGVSPQIIDKVYGHHCPSRHEAVGNALTRRNGK